MDFGDSSRFSQGTTTPRFSGRPEENSMLGNSSSSHSQHEKPWKQGPRHNSLLGEPQGLCPIYLHKPEVSAAVAVSDQGQPPPSSLGRSRARQTPDTVQIPFSEAEETISSPPLSLKDKVCKPAPPPPYTVCYGLSTKY